MLISQNLVSSRYGAPLCAALSLAGLSALPVSPASAQTYVFNNIASASSSSTTYGFARINDNRDAFGNGAVAYVAGPGTLTTTGSYYLSSGGSTSRLIGNGDTAPIAPTGSATSSPTYSFIDTTSYVLDNSNNLVFSGNVAGGGITTATMSGLFARSASGTTTTVVQRGVTPIPDSGNANTSNFSGPVGNYSANNNGRIAVQENNYQDSTGTTVSSGTAAIYTANQTVANKLNYYVPNSVTAPGVTGSAPKITAFAFPSLDNNGNTSFYGVITGSPTSGAGVFTASSAGALSKVVAVGDSAPNTTQANPVFTSFGKLSRNDNGQVAFQGGSNASDGNGTTSGVRANGIWYAQANGTIGSALALQGASDLDPSGTGNFGSSFTLGNINNSGVGVFYASGLTGPMTSADYIFTSSGITLFLGYGQSLFGSTVTGLGVPSINNFGEVSGNYTLANGQSGVFLYGNQIASAAAPEPASLAVLLLGGVAAFSYRRKGKVAARG